MVKSIRFFEQDPIFIISLLLMAAIPLSQLASSYLLAIAVLVAIVMNINSIFKILKKILILNWDLLLFFGLLLFGLICTSDMQYGLKVIESNLSFFGNSATFCHV